MHILVLYHARIDQCVFIIMQLRFLYRSLNKHELCYTNNDIKVKFNTIVSVNETYFIDNNVGQNIIESFFVSNYPKSLTLNTRKLPCI